MNIYLDIDDVLIKKDGRPTEFVTEFLKYITNNHEVYWLTSRFRDDISMLIAYLGDRLPEEALQYLNKIKASSWKNLKTEAIDLSKDFKWFSDNISSSEKKALLETNKYLSFFLVSPDYSFEDFVSPKNAEWIFQKSKNSWTKMEFKLELNEQEYNKISEEFILDRGQDEKWEFIFSEQTLYILRMGSNWVAYKVKFKKDGDKYHACEIYTAFERNKEKDSASQQWWNNYHSISIFYLIERYFFGNNLSYLVSSDVYNILKININGVHGFNHWRRVYEVGQYLASKNKADLNVIKYFAFLHDIARHNEFIDKEHALRASVFIKNNRKEFKLNNQQINQLVEAVENHNRGEYKSHDITIQACLDSDRIDLPRTGIEVDSEYLQTRAAKEYISKLNI